MQYQLINNEAKKQYEFHIDGNVPRIEYIHVPGKIFLTHTEVPPKLEGQGIGSALMTACLAAAAEAGFDNVCLGVWEHNAGGIRFYERWGFREFGRKVFHMGTDPQNDLIMSRALRKNDS